MLDCNDALTMCQPYTLARRFKRPVFLSIDVPWLNSHASGVSEEMAGRWSLMLEKQIVEHVRKALDERKSEGEHSSETVSEKVARIELQGEMVGR